MLIRDARDINAIDWQKMEGLVPAIVQDAFDGRVLMLAYMNREALAYSLDNGQVTFWSRSREELWTKGETSGNTLELKAVHADCDNACWSWPCRPDPPATAIPIPASTTSEKRLCPASPSWRPWNVSSRNAKKSARMAATPPACSKPGSSE